MARTFSLKGNLKRDFFILSAVIMLTVAVLSYITLYSHYNITKREYNEDLNRGADQVRSIFDNNLYYIEDRLKSLANSLNKIDTQNLTAVKEVLATSRVIDNRAEGPIPYTNFDWANPNGKMVVNTTLGILPEPRDISFRSYLAKARMSPQKVIIDDVIVGIPSGKLLIPVAIGIEKKNGNFLGTLTTGVDIERLNNLVQESISNSHVKYIILDAKYTDVAKNWVNMKKEPIAMLAMQLQNLHLTPTKNNNTIELDEPIQVEGLTFSKVSYTAGNQYIILVGYDKYYLLEVLFKNTLPALIGIIFIGLLIVTFILTIYKYVVSPVIALGKAAQDISLGKNPEYMPKSHISEVFLLSKQLIKIHSYISRHKNSIEILNEKQQEIASQKESLEHLTEVIDAADKANERILRDIRHTTNDGLNVISLSAALLASYFKGEAVKNLKNEEIISALENIQKEVNHIQNFTTDCLSFEMVDPVQVVNDAITVKRKPIMKRGIVLSTNIPEELPPIAVDRVRFNQIISGLIDRSISFLEGGHEITVSLITKTIEGMKYLECSVVDDGFGLKQQSRESFLDRENFESLDGVNLSIKSIEKLIDLHGGSLAIKDSAGVGSHITAIIPYRMINASKPDAEKNDKKPKKKKNGNVISLFE